MPDKHIRPTKKQKQLLSFIEQFINEHGYSPSYREIMRGCGYNSVATVALHVKSLITRGHLRKRDRSARSLEVVGQTPADDQNIGVGPSESGEGWLVLQIDQKLQFLESQAAPEASELTNVKTLIKSLRILELNDPADAFASRLAALDSSELQ